MPGFDYHAEAERIEAILEAANTTTAEAYLSLDLPKVVSKIMVDDPERTSFMWKDLPAIFIRARTAEQSFEDIGMAGVAAARSKSQKTVVWEIFGIIDKDGARKSNEEFLESVHDFARNTEAVFTNNMRLTGVSGSATVLWVYPKRTDFGDVVVNGAMLKGFRLDLEGNYRFK